MNTAIYFSTDKLSVVRGTANGQKVVVNGYMTALLPEGTLINGVITNAEPLEEMLMQLHREKKIGRRVRIAIESNYILAKLVDMPVLKHEDILRAVRREFQNTRTDYEEQIFDYRVMESNVAGTRHGRVLCCAMERQMLQSYEEVCRHAGLKVVSCDMGLNCMIKSAQLLPYAGDTSLVLASVENRSISCILLAEGKYLYSNKNILLEERGSDAWATEIAAKLSAINQFYKSEKGDVALKNVYFNDMNAQEIAQCRQAVAGLGVKVNDIPAITAILSKARDRKAPFAADAYLPAIGCLIRK